MPHKMRTVHVKIPVQHSAILRERATHCRPTTKQPDLIRLAVARLIYGRWKKDEHGYLEPI